MKRTASMQLDWETLGSDKEGWHQYLSLLPDIPGYPYADGLDGAVVVADHSNDGDDGPFVDGVFPEEIDWDFGMSLGLVDGDVKLTNEDFGISDTETAQEMMDAVNDLSPEDIADVLAGKGIAPVDATASRKASRRTAGLGVLDWEEYDPDDYGAELPSLPGYPYPIGVYVYDTEKGWWFEIGDGKTDLENTDFDIPTGSSAEEMMSAVENLDPQDVADKLTAIGYAPDENMDWPHTVDDD